MATKHPCVRHARGDTDVKTRVRSACVAQACDKERYRLWAVGIMFGRSSRRRHEKGPLHTEQCSRTKHRG